MHERFGRQYFFFFSSRRRHTRCSRDWSSDVCSSDLDEVHACEQLAIYYERRAKDFPRALEYAKVGLAKLRRERTACFGNSHDPYLASGSRGRRNALSSGRRGWKEKRRRGLRGHRAGVLRGRRSRRPIERFGESIKKPARRAFEGYATVAKTVEESAAVGCVELEEVRAPHQIGALRMFFLQCFGILPEETVCVHFAIEVQAGYEHQLLWLFLLLSTVTVAIPCGGQE